MTWSQVPLSDICTVDWGNTSLTKASYSEHGAYLAVSAAGPDGRIDHFEHEAGTPVLSAIGAQCGRMFLPDEPFTAIKNTMTLTPLPDKVETRLLFYLLESVQLPRRGAAQPFMSKGDVQSFEVSIPPREEQARIVALLDEATNAISELESVYSQTALKLTELRSSALASVMAEQEWPLVPLGEVVELAYGRALPAEDRTPDGVVPVFGANGIKAFTDQALHNEATIIVGRKGSVGELVRCEGPSWALDVAYYTIPDSTRVDQDYLYYWLTAADLPSLAKGVKPGLNRNEVYAKDLSLPPLEDQARIVALLDEVSAAADKALELATTRLEAAKALRQSILESAFRGEL